MQCDIRSALFSNYRLRLEQYREAVHRLQRDGEPLLRSDYLLLWKVANRASAVCMESQRKLEAHMKQHKCHFESQQVPKSATI